MITYEQAQADLAFWTRCAEWAEDNGISRWRATYWGLGGVCYGEMIRAAMLVLADHECCDVLHVSGAIDAVLQNARRRMLLRQARERRSVI